ncbi:MAG TPA: hypothetical protein DCX07_00670, partial [Phycisphaerales bacterium]|nr:hypothetical protein [Phycisphaerales bacterium]
VPRVDVPFATKLAVAASLLLCPRKRFAIPLNDVELFTSNESKRQYLRDDPLRLHEATAQFLYASWQLDGMLRNLPAGCLTMPVTLLLARRDRIIDNATTLAAVQRLAGGRARVEEFDADHTLEFEPAPQPLHRALARAVGAGE